MKAVNRLIPLFQMVLVAAAGLGAGCRSSPLSPGARAWGFKPQAVDEPARRVGRVATVPPATAETIGRESGLPVPNPYYRNWTAKTTSRRRQEIVRKLKAITLQKVEYPGIPLGEVVRHLNEETKRLDPEGKGINFMLLSPTATSEAGAQELAGAQAGPADPFGPAAGAGVRIEEADLEDVLVNIDPPLHDLPLVHVLDAITRKADTRIQFAVTDYAVVIWPKTPRDADRFFRNFRSSPGAFQQGLEGVRAAALNP